MVVEEKQTKIAPSVSIRALTFEGAALGLMIVMHEGYYPGFPRSNQLSWI